MDLDPASARMTDGVGDRLLGDPDDLALDAADERRQLVDGEIDLHLRRAAGEIGHALQRVAEALAIARVRPQRAHRSTRFDHVTPREIDGGVERLLDVRRQRVGRSLRGLQLHQDRGKALRQGVVNVARNPVSLLEHRLTTRFDAALFGDATVVEGKRGLPCHRLDERLAPRARAAAAARSVMRGFARCTVEQRHPSEIACRQHERRHHERMQVHLARERLN
jgi:hypothetical protein